MKFSSLLAGIFLATGLVNIGHAQTSTPFDSVLSQYSAAWSDQSGYRMDGAQWDPKASYRVTFQLIPQEIRDFVVSGNTEMQFNFYSGNFQGRLRGFAQRAQSQGLAGQALLDATTAFLDSTFTRVRPQLALMYPGYPDDVYKAMVIQNLSHGIYAYGTSYYYETITGQVAGTAPILQNGQLTASKELESLLELTTADCGELAELNRVLGRAWGLDMRYVGIAPDYNSGFAGNTRVQAGVHAIDALVYSAPNGAKQALLIDSVTNTAIAPGPLAQLFPGEMVGDGIIASASHAVDRYMALANKGRIMPFFDYYMHPPVRSGYLKSSIRDASLIKFMYAYYLEAYPNPSHSYTSYPAWQANNFSWSARQSLN
jgi:hypothetical protein